MSVYLLPEEPVFPPVDEAEPDGLMAIGGDLSVNRLINAYEQGIFPWFMEDDDIFWYSPNPRMVLFPEKFRVSGSLSRIIRNHRFEVRFDTVFDQVTEACSKVPRPGQDSTWINAAFKEAYQRLFDLGFAHSVETFKGNELVGGLYGVSLGAAFFGESMFFLSSNASKIALYYLVERCRELSFNFIDCQTETEHLKRVGAVALPREEYLVLLHEAIKAGTGKWLK
ncbi:MAG: leucyl/phenylalanyl-tRNA--protein transferase [Bacteroidota bacterium]